VTELGHGSDFDLADSFRGQVKVLPNLNQGPGLAPVESKAEGDDPAFPLIEDRQELADLGWEQAGDRHLERRPGRAILDHIAPT
jgi:hypothetical protein